MCLMRPECQRCQTCGLRKYQFWIDKEMHDPGCPWGSPTPQACKDARNYAQNVVAMRDAGVAISADSQAFLLMFPEYARQAETSRAGEA